MLKCLGVLLGYILPCSSLVLYVGDCLYHFHLSDTRQANDEDSPLATASHVIRYPDNIRTFRTLF